MAEKEIIHYSVPSAGIRLRTVDMKNERIYRDLHFHPDVEIVQLREGSLLCQVDDRAIPLKTGDMLVIGQGVPHKLLPQSDTGLFFYVQINIGQYLERYFSEEEQILYSLSQTDTLAKFHLVEEDGFYGAFSRFCEEYYGKLPGYELNLQAYALNTVAYMLRNNLLPPLPQTKETDYRSIIPVLKYIRENYANTITLEQISSHFHMSSYHFCRVFKKATGTTLFTYLNKVRLACAEKELLQTAKPVYEVALDCGFPSTTYFNTLFKKAKAMSPKQFRLLFREGGL